MWSVECEDFASSLAEKIKRLSREGHGRDRVSLNYRSFMFGKLPPPACPGLCYMKQILKKSLPGFIFIPSNCLIIVASAGLRIHNVCSNPGSG